MEYCDPLSNIHALRTLQHVASWSRGMIPALGAGGPGFKSRRGPFFLNTFLLFLN